MNKQKELLKKIKELNSFTEQLNFIFWFVHEEKYDFLTYLVLLKPVDEYLSSTLLDHLNTNKYTIGSFSRTRRYLPQFNKKWIDYFQSQFLLKKLL